MTDTTNNPNQAKPWKRPESWKGPMPPMHPYMPTPPDASGNGPISQPKPSAAEITDVCVNTFIFLCIGGMFLFGIPYLVLHFLFDFKPDVGFTGFCRAMACLAFGLMILTLFFYRGIRNAIFGSYY